METFDAAVIGAGVIGLAVANELAGRGARVAVLERRDAPGLEQSTHNSGVVHAGFVATPGTLRARLNVEGARRLYARAPELGVPIARSGTLVAARHASEEPQLDRFLAQGRANGVEGVRRLDPEEVREVEPGIAPVVAGLHAPGGGRVDAVRLVRALEAELRRSGGELRCSCALQSVTHDALGRWVLWTSGEEVLRSTTVINAAGVASARVAALLGAPGYQVYPCLGEYAVVDGPSAQRVRSMVYGLPPSGYPGIGVHLTRRFDGSLLIGPTALYQESETAPQEPRTALEEFHREAEVWMPGLAREELRAGGMGVRAKVVPPGSPSAFGDYLIEEAPAGSGAIQLVGLESPGLTASLAVGAYVADLLADRSVGSRPRFD